MTSDNETTPIVARINHFNDDGVESLRNDITSAIEEQQPILLVEIDSFGGEVYSLLAMIDYIETAKQVMTVATYACGKAMSCGAVLLSAGTPGFRFAGAHSTVMIHQVHGTIDGTAEDIRTSEREINRLNETMISLLGKYSGKGTPYIRKQMKLKQNADWHMTAKECKKHGLIDHVKTPIHIVQVGKSHNLFT